MALERPVVLTFAGHYLPGFKAGGPIRTLVNLVDRLGDAFDFRIVAADRDLGDTAPFADVPVDVWTQYGSARLFYRSPGAGGWRSLLASSEVRRPDILYLNGFFGLRSSILPLIDLRRGRLDRAPTLLAPRGEFSAGALGLKAAKKRAFIAASRAVGLHSRLTFQASSEYEAADITRTLGDVPVHIAPDLPGRAAGAPEPARPRPAGAPFRLAFLARISPMKNLIGAIDILSRVHSVPIVFDIHGVVEDADCWARCEAAIEALPPNVQATYKGPVAPDQVQTVLSGYDAFLLPTLGENYGHVIREALSAGLPVLISDRTPWRGLEASGAGADLPLDDLDAFADRIRAWEALPLDRFQSMREAARVLGDDPAAAGAAVEANRRMFLAALRHGA
jgi:glycosyltransferase involved in cell wall biosynthesis